MAGMGAALVTPQTSQTIDDTGLAYRSNLVAALVSFTIVWRPACMYRTYAR